MGKDPGVHTSQQAYLTGILKVVEVSGSWISLGIRTTVEGFKKVSYTLHPFNIHVWV